MNASTMRTYMRLIETTGWDTVWNTTTTLPIGHILYHGTNEIFDDEDLIFPAWFSSSREVASHFARSGRIYSYEVEAPITIPTISDRNEMKVFCEMFDIDRSSVEDIRDSMSKARLPGWIIPNNYQNGDDILLIHPHNLRLMRIEEA